MISVVWYLLQDKPFEDTYRSAPLPQFFKSMEVAIIKFKKENEDSKVGAFLKNYIAVTGSGQFWRLFAPNPIGLHRWLTVYAVVDFKTEDSGDVGATLRKRAQNGHFDRTPIFDPDPIYKSYNGNLSDRLKNFADSYFEGPKFVENLMLPHMKLMRYAFAKYCNRKYAVTHAITPLEIDVNIYDGRVVDHLWDKWRPVDDYPEAIYKVYKYSFIKGREYVQED